MENASKALLMAGGVLIAIIIISLLVRTYGNIGSFQRQQLSAEEAEKLESYNKEYTKYLNQYVYGTEVITVINKSLNNKSHDITVHIKFKDAYKFPITVYKNGKKVTEYKLVKAGKELRITNTDDNAEEYYAGLAIGSTSDLLKNDKDEYGNEQITGLKSRAFKCTSVGYDSNGRVNSIKFEEKMYNGGTEIE